MSYGTIVFANNRCSSARQQQKHVSDCPSRLGRDRQTPDKNDLHRDDSMVCDFPLKDPVCPRWFLRGWSDVATVSIP